MATLYTALHYDILETDVYEATVPYTQRHV